MTDTHLFGSLVKRRRISTLMNNNLKNSCKDKSFLSDLRFLPSNLRIKAFEKKRVKQILNAAMERAPYTAMLMMISMFNS
eukprot:scaffold35404_cov80-Skeletonema_marinoi.AAC.1